MIRKLLFDGTGLPKTAFSVQRQILSVPVVMALLLMSVTAHANNIRVWNLDLTDQNISEGYWIVEFDLRWDNSWRTDNINPDDEHEVGNWDAAWLFVKYRDGDGDWKHAKLHNEGHSPGTGTPATLQIGLPDEHEAFHISDNPGAGAFIYRSENGSGTFSTSGNRLRWNYAVDGVADDADLDLKFFAIEMVYVAPGPFYAGGSGTETGRFREGGEDFVPFFVTEDWDGCMDDVKDCLWGSAPAGPRGPTHIGNPGSLDEHHPTGVNGFYSMKYQVSQGQYVDFLNTLTREQQASRVAAVTEGTYVSNTGNVEVPVHRNSVRVMSDPGGTAPRVYGNDLNNNGIAGESDDGQWIAMNMLSWMDGAAYLDWAGLRPMTELEYEKAARGPATPEPDEYAWGNAQIVRATGFENGGQSDESPTPENANANNLNFSNQNLQGPLRVGSFAHSNSDREQSGAGYWGIMELSGNLWDLTVTVAIASGRNYTGLHGNGELTAEGYANAVAWPGEADNGVTEALGSGSRGGAWERPSQTLRISDRTAANGNVAQRFNNTGIRGVRSLPTDGNG